MDWRYGVIFVHTDFWAARAVVSEWSGRRRRAERTGLAALTRAPSARTIARLLTTSRERLSRADPLVVAAVENGVAVLTEARAIIGEFQRIIRRQAPTELEGWIENAKGSLVATFVNGIEKDKAAVKAAVSSPWSNGQTEGQICKLKLVKRQMYGRGKLDLLEARVIGFASDGFIESASEPLLSANPGSVRNGNQQLVYWNAIQPGQQAKKVA